tara:strand:- start:119 stop:289 length:171 start_codon:yes stop_codon:yes gene_type:complete
MAYGDCLISPARVLNFGGSISDVHSDVFSVNKDEEILVATALVTVKSKKIFIEPHN